MPTAPPKVVQFLGDVYRLVDSSLRMFAYSQEKAEQLMARGLAELGGAVAEGDVGGPDELTEDGRPWTKQVVAPVFKLVASSPISEAVPYERIDWFGLVSVELIDGKPVMSAEGTLEFDGADEDDQARVLGRDAVIYGRWTGRSWQWSLRAKEE